MFYRINEQKGNTMAYMNQAKKNELAPAIKAVLKKYGVKGSISVRNYSTLIVTLTSGPVDLGGDLFTVYNVTPAQFKGDAFSFLTELDKAMNGGNFDESDAMTDYFYVGWYTEIRVGKVGKEYQVTA